MGSNSDNPFEPKRPKARKRYRATYVIRKTVTVDAYDRKEAEREVDDFISAIRGEVLIESIEVEV